jgi:hypothetical protein
MDSICTQCGGTANNEPCYPSGNWNGQSLHWYSLEDEIRDVISALIERIDVLEAGSKPHFQPPSTVKKIQQKGGTPL